MINTQVIFADDQYKQYCKSVSNYSSQWQDLYQMFAEEIWTKRNNIVENVDGFCKGIIYKLWRSYNGSDTSRKKKGEHMLLANYSDRGLKLINERYENSSHSEYSIEKGVLLEDPQDTDTSEVNEEFTKLLNSPNKRIRVKAEITQEFINGTNRLKISKERGINYRIAHSSVEHTIEAIKTNMTKQEIKDRLLAEGVSASYSGKNKTFYVSKAPSKEVESMIIKAGFKQCKK